MARLRIYTFPDEVLSQKAKPIERVEAKFRSLADDMLETMYEAPGIGLAANQVGILDRIVVVDTEYDTEDAPEDEQGRPQFLEGAEDVDVSGIVRNRKPIILINPEIIYKEGEIILCEGCLSVPEYTSEVKRADKIKVRYQDIDGLSREMATEGLQAVCIQHELDHLDGKLFIDRLSPLKREMAKKKLLREKSRKSSEKKDR